MEQLQGQGQVNLQNLMDLGGGQELAGISNGAQAPQMQRQQPFPQQPAVQQGPAFQFPEQGAAPQQPGPQQPPQQLPFPQQQPVDPYAQLPSPLGPPQQAPQQFQPQVPQQSAPQQYNEAGELVSNFGQPVFPGQENPLFQGDPAQMGFSAQQSIQDLQQQPQQFQQPQNDYSPNPQQQFEPNDPMSIFGGTAGEAVPKPISDYLQAKGIENPSEFFASELSTLRDSAERYDALSQENVAFQGRLESLPPDLKLAFDGAMSGEDNWRDNLLLGKWADTTGKNMDPQVLQVLHGAPNDITHEDWVQYVDKEGDEQVKGRVDRIVDQWRREHDNARSGFRKAEKNLADQRAAASEAFNNSIGPAMKKFRSSVKVDPNYARSIEKELVSGAVMNLFFDENGAYKDDAAVKFMMARDGMGYINKLMERTKTDAQNHAMMNVIQRTPERMAYGQGRGPGADGNLARSQGFQRQMGMLQNLDRRF